MNLWDFAHQHPYLVTLWIAIGAWAVIGLGAVVRRR